MGVEAMYVSVNSDQYRLELFDGKAYRVAATGTLRELEPATERAIAAGNKSRRITLAAKDRALKPSWRFGSRSYPCSVTDGSTFRMEATCCAYLDWAIRHGLKTVSVYRGSYGERNAAAFARNVVDVADFLGDAPQAEPDDMPEAMAA